MSAIPADAITATQLATEAIKLAASLVALAVIIIPLLTKKDRRQKKKAVQPTDANRTNTPFEGKMAFLHGMTWAFASAFLWGFGFTYLTAGMFSVGLLIAFILFLSPKFPIERREVAGLVIESLVVLTVWFGSVLTTVGAN